MITLIALVIGTQLACVLGYAYIQVQISQINEAVERTNNRLDLKAPVSSIKGFRK
jgi:hypothetical protein